MKILLYYSKKGIPKGTGSGTNTQIVLKELGKYHDFKIYSSSNDLQYKWDLIHALDLKHLDKEVLEQKRCPIVVNVRDYYFNKFYPFYCPDLPIRYFLQKKRKYQYSKIFNSIDNLILHSHFMVKQINHPKKHLVRHTILKNLSNNKKFTTRKNQILYVGRDYYRKGLHTLFKALPLVLNKYPETILHVVGKEPSHSLYFAKLESSKLPVKFYPKGLFGNKLHQLYKQCKTLVVPSNIEAFGITFLEAMSAGIIPIGTNVGGIPEIIKHNQNGFLIEPSDNQALAKYIIKSFEISDSTYSILKNAMNKTLSFYSKKHMIDDLNKAYLNSVNYNQT